MPSNFPRFRWWYLLLLLPLALYFGARWYVGHRIDQAIASANGGGNSLTVGDYGYGLFPLHLSAESVSFRQDRDKFSARGTLSTLYVGGLHVFSLIGSGPIELERIRLGGLDAEFTRTGVATADSSTLQLEVSEVELDSIFLTVLDQTTGREVAVSDFALSLQTFHLPLQPTELRSLQLTADSITYHDQRDGTRLIAGGIGYGTGTEAILVAELQLRRGDSTDVRAEGLTLTGINAEDVDGVFSIDSLSVDRLSGGARVPGNTQTADTTSSGNTPPIRVRQLHFPQIDLRVAGAFGEATYAGSLQAEQLAFRDSLTVEHLRAEGDTLGFSNGSGTTVNLQGVDLQQSSLCLPLDAARLGPTRLDVPAFTVRFDGRSVSGERLTYGSENGELSAEMMKVEFDRTRGSVENLRVTGIDRNELLTGTPAVLEQAFLDGVQLVARTRDGGRYEAQTPQVTLDAITLSKPFGIERLRIENARFERYGKEGQRDMTGRGIYVDQRGITAPVRPTRFGPTKARMAELRMASDELPLDYIYSNMAYDSRAGSLTLDSLRRRNRLSSAEMFRQKITKSWLEFDFDGLRLTGIRHDPLIRGEMVYVDSIHAKDFRLRVVEDLSLDLPPNPNRPMPIEALRKIGPRIVLNGARFSSTDIAYGVVDSLMDPKTIHFSDGTVQLRDLDTAVSDTDSVRVFMDATFERSTPLHAEFDLSRDSVARGYAARGELGTYDLSRVNPLMRIAADAIIENGTIEKLTYSSRMDGDTIKGDMVLLYRDLDLKVVGSGAWIKNLLSGVVVKNDNSRGEDFRPGRIYHVHTPEKSFFNSYWKGLVSGMKSSAMSDIALPDELD